MTVELLLDAGCKNFNLFDLILDTHNDYDDHDDHE
jgi:hypothetical protein